MLKNPNFLSSFSLKLISLKAFSSDIHSGQHFYQTHLKNTSVSVFLGDLTEEKTDAIVNAANSDLLHGGGVAGAIRVKGGNSIQSDSNAYVRKFGRVETGQVALTKAGNLKCKFIIHAVGPIWKGGNQKEEELLRSCLLMRKANENKFQSIAIPAISTGIYGFPKELAAQIFAKTIHDYISSEITSLNEIKLIDRSDKIIALWIKELEDNFKTNSLNK